MVTFINLLEHIDLALQAIGESIRISRAWAAVGEQRMSSKDTPLAQSILHQETQVLGGLG
ncbi:MAG: hypothetical protein LZF60_170099 [Nitrospira sp.]|nr:hypothetical protein [Nitrospira sp.]ULA59960.1 MAG: hypothetical protein LZF60_170099 [Nitrospira sp.]